jgi:hypothetical protein
MKYLLILLLAFITSVTAKPNLQKCIDCPEWAQTMTVDQWEQWKFYDAEEHMLADLRAQEYRTEHAFNYTGLAGTLIATGFVMDILVIFAPDHIAHNNTFITTGTALGFTSIVAGGIILQF